MNAPIRELPLPARPVDIGAEEWALRLELAACYRLFSHLGWTEMIFNHITQRVPGDEPQFLINPYGLHYSEVTARNLVKIDLQGRVIGESAYPINPAGFVIHAAVHANRPDAHCIIHTHTIAGCAVSMQKQGLLPLNQHALQVLGEVAYHNYEGSGRSGEERGRFLANLGERHIMVLRNHGLIVIGETIGEAFILTYRMERACAMQLQFQKSGAEFNPIDDDVARAAIARGGAVSDRTDPKTLEWVALLRKLDRIDPSYKE